MKRIYKLPYGIMPKIKPIFKIFYGVTKNNAKNSKSFHCINKPCPLRRGRGGEGGMSNLNITVSICQVSIDRNEVTTIFILFNV